MSELWDSALYELKGRLSPENFETWLAPVQCRQTTDHQLKLAIPNSFYADWISSHYLDLLLEALERRTGKRYQVEWV